MNVNHSHDDDPSAKARTNRAAARLRVYELERLAYTDAANLAPANRKPAGQRWKESFKALLHWIK
jgi:hypothetical protein